MHDGTSSEVARETPQWASSGTQAVREGWFGTLLAHSRDLIAVVDKEGRVIYANPEAERLLGFVPAEQIGRNVFELVHPEDLQATAERFAQVLLEAGTSPPAVLRFQSASGDWKVLESIATNCLDDPEVKGIVLNARDVTEETNMSRAIRTLSQGNDVLVHATDETSLLADTCQAIVATGGYLLAWVGFGEQDDRVLCAPSPRRAEPST